MNIKPILSSLVIPEKQPVKNSLDITLKDPVLPIQNSETASPQIGSITGVLTPEENHAIELLFNSTQFGYTANGTNQYPQSISGMRIDIHV
tara:strand:- start:354 stop:626 length:273 start_codon:yes stop_codon:yes gene_type:complete